MSASSTYAQGYADAYDDASLLFSEFSEAKPCGPLYYRLSENTVRLLNINISSLESDVNFLPSGALPRNNY